VLCRHRLQGLTLRVPRLPKASGLGTNGAFPPAAWQASVRSTLENIIEPDRAWRRNPVKRSLGALLQPKNGAPQLSHDSVLDLNE
jgi:hypothetical protein